MIQQATACTGIAASWCPIHGDCTCPDDDCNNWLRAEYGDDCPLHGHASNHAEDRPETSPFFPGGVS